MVVAFNILFNLQRLSHAKNRLTCSFGEKHLLYIPDPRDDKRYDTVEFWPSMPHVI
jgi:hypothetical protein